MVPVAGSQVRCPQPGSRGTCPHAQGDQGLEELPQDLPRARGAAEQFRGGDVEETGRQRRVEQLMLWSGFEPGQWGQLRGPARDGVEHPDPGEEVAVGLGCGAAGFVGLAGGCRPQDCRVGGPGRRDGCRAGRAARRRIFPRRSRAV